MERSQPKSAAAFSLYKTAQLDDVNNTDIEELCDNASSDDLACTHSRRTVPRPGCIGDGKYIHIRCIAHIINLIMWNGIKEHGVCINSVGSVVKYVKNSPARLHRFKELVQKANEDSKSSLSFDVPIRWNSTYTMLDTTVKYLTCF